MLKRYAKNLNQLTLPEIIDFNALADTSCLRYFVKRYSVCMKEDKMQAKDAAERLGITQRMLRHYEKEGLMEVGRMLNGYRHYSEVDLRRAGRIRDFIAIGFSTREIRAMSACLSDDGSGPCEGGIAKLTDKLAHIDRLRTDLDARRAAVLDRLAVLEHGIPQKQNVALKALIP